MNKIKLIGMMVFIAAATWGCATTPKASEEQKIAAMMPVHCPDKQTCEVQWQRAQAWVASHSAYRMQIVSDSVLQTYGPMGSDTGLAFMLTKTPNLQGGAAITIRASCDNMFGCIPDRYLAILSLKADMQSAGP
ncbi:hypothetical protein [Thiomonas sp.]|uniref:hypothetical protein n=1 Tax=Thiomonas sp. TaxID=2047785 RepID=UPI00258B068F|nr:hypothetical protein [Thiomonas sp.]